MARAHKHKKIVTLGTENNSTLVSLYGQHDANIRLLADKTGTAIQARGNQVQISGQPADILKVEALLDMMLEEASQGDLALDTVHVIIQGFEADAVFEPQDVVIRTKAGSISGRSPNQKRYLHNILTHDINFGIGPAGTGKTFLAVAAAVDAIQNDQVQRIVLVRPAVEAGERLGFLPGDLSDKVDPYLRPLYDALYDMLGTQKVEKMIEKKIIEVAPLAFMRGRTLNNAFVILDEAQNTTVEQMKMFLTRTGFGTTVVVTGDVTQVDLPRGQISGLKHAIDVLHGIEGISFSWFKPKDVVRHSLVQDIIRAYEGKHD